MMCACLLWQYPVLQVPTHSSPLAFLAGLAPKTTASRAVAASLLTTSYDILRDGAGYRDPGPLDFERRENAKPIRALSGDSPTSDAAERSRLMPRKAS